MAQLGQVVQMKSKTAGGEALWGYRYRVGRRGSRRVQRGGFQSERDAGEALERALERLRRANGTATTLTFARLVDEHLAQHDAQPETISPATDATTRSPSWTPTAGPTKPTSTRWTSRGHSSSTPSPSQPTEKAISRRNLEAL